jgi:hypothetical protein
MKAVLICYTLKDAKHDIRSAFKREFIGYTDKSNNGAYEYKREGLLGRIPHLKPAKGVIIVKDTDQEKVKSLLKKYKAKIKSFNIDINQSVLH